MFSSYLEDEDDTSLIIRALLGVQTKLITQRRACIAFVETQFVYNLYMEVYLNEIIFRGKYSEKREQHTSKPNLIECKRASISEIASNNMARESRGK